MAVVLFPPALDDGGRSGFLKELCRTLRVDVVELAILECAEALRPLVSVVPAQRLAAELARLTDGDPDRSRNAATRPRPD